MNPNAPELAPSTSTAPQVGAAIWLLHRDCSEQTAREIDQEVKKAFGPSYAEAKTILGQRRLQLGLDADELLKRETLDGEMFRRLIQQERP